jgi:hypothetical protein
MFAFGIRFMNQMAENVCTNTRWIFVVFGWRNCAILSGNLWHRKWRCDEHLMGKPEFFGRFLPKIL